MNNGPFFLDHHGAPSFSPVDTSRKKNFPVFLRRNEPYTIQCHSSPTTRRRNARWHRYR